MNPMQINPMALASQQMLTGGVQPGGPMGGPGGAAGSPMIPPGMLPPPPPGAIDPTQMMGGGQGAGMAGLDPRKMAYVKALMGGR